MLVEIQVNGEIIPLELEPRLIDEQDENRKWELVSIEKDHPIKIVFNERAHILKEIENTPDILYTTYEDLQIWINDFLKEQLELRQSGIESNDESEQAEPQPYDPHKINIRSQNWSVSHMFELINKWEQVELAPDFQRGFVWDYARKSRLIESLMLRIPVPAFYLSETENGRYQVVDGLQRLTTITQFLKNQFQLKYLEYLEEQEGRYFEDDDSKKHKGIDVNYWRNILQTQITVNIIEASSPAKVKFDVFRRVNTGGKPLNNQEIRNCLAEKHTRELMNELAFSRAFQAATSGSVSTARMEAQELVLRFIGLWHDRVKKYPDWSYRGNMTEYLDRVIDLLNSGKSANFEEIQEAFYSGMLNSEYLFAQYCFRKCLPEHLLPNVRQQLINKSLYSTWSVVLSTMQHSDISLRIPKGTMANILANELQKDEEYFYVVSYKTNDKRILDKAFNKTTKLLIDSMANYMT